MQRAGAAFGAVAIYSVKPQEWTAEQFRLAEWLAGQCAQILETLRMQQEVARVASFPTVNPQPIVEADLDGRVTYANPAAQQLFPDLQRRGAEHPWLADWQSVSKACRAGTGLSGRDVIVEDRIYHQTIHCMPQTGRIRTYGLDITERKRRVALATLHAEQQTIFDSVPALIWKKDTKNNFVRVNRAVAHAVGKPAAEIEGRNARELFPDEAERYYQDDLEVICSGQPKLGIVEPMQIASGEKRWVQTDKVPYYDECGSITGVLVFSVDVTERKRAEEALQAARTPPSRPRPPPSRPTAPRTISWRSSATSCARP